jgi:hypothetical protein
MAILDARGNLIAKPSAVVPAWEQALEKEMSAFVGTVEKAFAHGLEATRVSMPDESPQNRAIQLNYFMDALVAAVVKVSCIYGGPDKEIEDAITRGTREKFEAVRKQKAAFEAKNAGQAQ